MVYDLKHLVKKKIWFTQILHNDVDYMKTILYNNTLIVKGLSYWEFRGFTLASFNSRYSIVIIYSMNEKILILKVQKGSSIRIRVLILQVLIFMKEKIIVMEFIFNINSFTIGSFHFSRI